MNELEFYEKVMIKEFIEENWAMFVEKVGTEEEAEEIIKKFEDK
ncbi:hypothetical protein [Paenibacillus cremeus]|nr:hypothetical protein [Paenibacillus cremeus]